MSKFIIFVLLDFKKKLTVVSLFYFVRLNQTAKNIEFSVYIFMFWV